MGGLRRAGEAGEYFHCPRSADGSSTGSIGPPSQAVQGGAGPRDGLPESSSMPKPRSRLAETLLADAATCRTVLPASFQQRAAGGAGIQYGILTLTREQTAFVAAKPQK